MRLVAVEFWRFNRGFLAVETAAVGGLNRQNSDSKSHEYIGEGALYQEHEKKFMGIR